MKKAIFFDVNETLLDLSRLKVQFARHFGDAHVLKYWFTKLLHNSSIMAAMDEYRDFGELAGAALEGVFFENGKRLTTDIKTEILSEFRKLPAHSDVKPALSELREHSIRLVAVSNSSKEMMQAHLTHAGSMELFDAYYSVDQVRKYKPFKEIYLFAADQEKLNPEEIIMVAAYDWDLFGAKKVGLTTAYITRKKEIYHPFYPKADFVISELSELLKVIER
ncbi:MAG: haloacid dehalogenase type II [Bacteroidota bacterium]